MRQCVSNFDFFTVKDFLSTFKYILDLKIYFFYLHFFVRSDEWKIETNINIHLFGTRPIPIIWQLNDNTILHVHSVLKSTLCELRDLSSRFEKNSAAKRFKTIKHFLLNTISYKTQICTVYTCILFKYPISVIKICNK